VILASTDAQAGGGMNYHNLIDPGKSDHPPEQQTYNGIQDFGRGQPKQRLFTCRVCGTTLAARHEPEHAVLAD